MIKGVGTLADSSTVIISNSRGLETDRIKSKHIIIATGGRARAFPGVKIDGKLVITSKEVLLMNHPPKSMIIVGAGSIGIEFGYLYHRFGTKIETVEMMSNILPTVDREISDLLKRNFEKKRIRIHTKATVKSIKPYKNKVTAIIAHVDGIREISADCCLIAIGVYGNIEDIGLEKVGVKTQKNAIITDEFMRTNVKGIYVIGDLAGAPWLEHIASHEDIVCVDKIAGKDAQGMNYRNFPACTYCKPQVATIGLTEQKALEEGYNIKVGRYPFSANGKARVIGETEGLVKVIFDSQYRELLGAHIIGPEATELISEFCLAKTLECNDEEITHTIHAHPTLSEAIREATLNVFQGAIHI